MTRYSASSRMHPSAAVGLLRRCDSVGKSMGSFPPDSMDVKATRKGCVVFGGEPSVTRGRHRAEEVLAPRRSSTHVDCMSCMAAKRARSSSCLERRSASAATKKIYTSMLSLTCCSRLPRGPRTMRPCWAAAARLHQSRRFLPGRVPSPCLAQADLDICPCARRFLSTV